MSCVTETGQTREKVRSEKVFFGFFFYNNKLSALARCINIAQIINSCVCAPSNNDN